MSSMAGSLSNCRPQDLSTNSNPYLDGAIGMLSDSTAFLYDDDAPWAVRVAEVKRGVDRVDAKVDEVKTQVDEVKTQVNEVKTQVDEVKTQMKSMNVLRFRSTTLGSRWTSSRPASITIWHFNKTLYGNGLVT